VPIPKKRTHNPRNQDDRARAMKIAVSIVRAYCDKTDAGLWDSIVNQNSSIKFPIREAFEDVEIELTKGRLPIKELLNYDTSKESLGKCFSEVISSIDEVLNS